MTTDMRYIQFLLAVIPAVTNEQNPPNESSAVDVGQLLGASREQLELLEDGKKADLIELAPVHLPTNPPGDCNHYGWPVATITLLPALGSRNRLKDRNYISKPGF